MCPCKESTRSLLGYTQGRFCKCISGVYHEHTHIEGMLVNAHFYTHQMHLMLIRQHKSLLSTTKNQFCKLPSLMCNVGPPGHAEGQAHLLLASLKKRNRYGDIICNTLFNSLPHEETCSPHEVWTKHCCPGKMIFVLSFLYTYTKFQG